MIVARDLIDRREAVIVEQRAKLERAALRVGDLERVATKLSERVVERERQLKEMRAELGGLNSSTDQGMRAMVAVAAELDAVREQARGQATRIRLQALSEAAELSDKLSLIAQRPLEVRERLVATLTEALARAEDLDDGADRAVEAEVEKPATEDAEPEPALDGDVNPEAELDPISELAAEVEATVAETEPVVIAAPKDVESEPETVQEANAVTVPAQPDSVFTGKIEVEIGPLGDFSQLVGFEDAASGIAGTSEISVKRFAQGRATLEMHLDSPVELLRELEGRAPFEFEFEVRDTRDGRVVLDLAVPEPQQH